MTSFRGRLQHKTAVILTSMRVIHFRGIHRVELPPRYEAGLHPCIKSANTRLV